MQTQTVRLPVRLDPKAIFFPSGETWQWLSKPTVEAMTFCETAWIVDSPGSSITQELDAPCVTSNTRRRAEGETVGKVAPRPSEPTFWGLLDSLVGILQSSADAQSARTAPTPAVGNGTKP